MTETYRASIYQQYSPAEQAKQRLDLIASAMWSLEMFALTSIPIGKRFEWAWLDMWGLPIGFWIAVINLLPSAISLFWLMGRCVERPDFNSLPRARVVWGLCIVSSGGLLIISALLRGSHGV